MAAAARQLQLSVHSWLLSYPVCRRYDQCGGLAWSDKPQWPAVFMCCLGPGRAGGQPRLGPGQSSPGTRRAGRVGASPSHLDSGQGPTRSPACLPGRTAGPAVAAAAAARRHVGRRAGPGPDGPGPWLLGWRRLAAAVRS